MKVRQPRGGREGAGWDGLVPFVFLTLTENPPKTMYSFLKTYKDIKAPPIPGVGGTETHSRAPERGATIGFSRGGQAK